MFYRNDLGATVAGTYGQEIADTNLCPGGPQGWGINEKTQYLYSVLNTLFSKLGIPNNVYENRDLWEIIVSPPLTPVSSLG